MHKSAIVVGAGIVGLATARALATRKYDVKVIERTGWAIGASIRNFGMIWPVGQPDGKLYERALLSANIWKEICREAKIWHDEVGSLHLPIINMNGMCFVNWLKCTGIVNINLLSPDAVMQIFSSDRERKFIGSIVQSAGNDR